jgi:hypothetical protein
MLGIGNGLSRGAVLSGLVPDGVAGLQIWYKLNTDITPAQWDDSSGNGRHLVQGDGDRQASITNGGLHLTTDGSTNDFYNITGNSGTTIDGGVAPVQIKHPNPFTMFVVFRRTGGDADQNVIVADNNANNWVGFTDDDQMKIHDATTNFAADTFANSAKMLLMIRKDSSGNLTFNKNGAALAIASGDTASTGTNDFKVDFFAALKEGTNNSNDKHFDGEIYEFAMYDESLTTAELEGLNAYFQGVHGL